MSVERTLNFNWSGLSQNTTILLTFNKLVKSQLTLKQNYVAWKVIEARAPNGSATVHFTGRVGFAQSEMDDGQIVRGSTFIEVPLGSTTNLIEGPDHLNVFEQPVKDPQTGTLVKVKNNTSMRQSLSVGTFTNSSSGTLQYSPAFYWGGVGTKLSIEADFHPTLMVFVGKEYRENQLITADLASDVLWTQNLASLSSTTSIDLVETAQGGFEIRVT